MSDLYISDINVYQTVCKEKTYVCLTILPRITCILPDISVVIIDVNVGMLVSDDISDVLVYIVAVVISINVPLDDVVVLALVNVGTIVVKIGSFDFTNKIVRIVAASDKTRKIKQITIIQRQFRHLQRFFSLLSIYCHVPSFKVSVSIILFTFLLSKES